MKLLLDTHVVLWWLDDPALIEPAAQSAIADQANRVFISAAVAWEIAIKRALGKLTCPDDLEAAIRACGFLQMPVTIAHALATESLPPHHRDPFDRLLIAQAQLEGCHLLTRDPLIASYGIPVITT